MPIDPETRRAPNWLLLSILIALLPWSWVVNIWFVDGRYYEPLLHASRGLLHPSMQVCLPTILALLLLFRVAGLAPRDVGLKASKLPAGVLATLLLWLAVNAVALASTGGELVWSDHEGRSGPLVLGHLLGQFLGNAFFEELVYRGLFLAQLVLLLRSRGRGATRAAWTAALLSAVIFAVPHIPNRIMKEAYDGPLSVVADQGRLVASGLLLAWIYLRTQNLWWAIGLHGLANYPTVLLDWDYRASPKEVVVLFTLVMTLVWPWVARRDDRGGRVPAD